MNLDISVTVCYKRQNKQY